MLVDHVDVAVDVGTSEPGGFHCSHMFLGASDVLRSEGAQRERLALRGIRRKDAGTAERSASTGTSEQNQLLPERDWRYSLPARCSEKIRLVPSSQATPSKMKKKCDRSGFNAETKPATTKGKP